MDVKDQLRIRMEQLKVSVNELAKQCGVSNQSVRHWLNGRSYPGKKHIPEIEKRLSMKLDFSPGTSAGLPTADATLQVADLQVFLKFSRLTNEEKRFVSMMVDLMIAQHGNDTPESLHDLGPPARHSPGRTARQVAAR